MMLSALKAGLATWKDSLLGTAHFPATECTFMVDFFIISKITHAHSWVVLQANRAGCVPIPCLTHFT